MAEQDGNRGATVASLLQHRFEAHAGELRIGGRGVRALADEHGTPLYVYDLEGVRRRVHALRDALPSRFDICYSVKANPSQALIRCLLAQGCGMEIASRGELHQVLVAGCDAGRVLFAGPGKRDDELEQAVVAGVGEIHVESLAEARRLEAIAERHSKTVRIALRINPAGAVEGGGMRMGGRPAPFGIDEDQVEDVIDALRASPWLRIVGVHLYMGTQILDAALLLRQYGEALDIARRVASRCGYPLETLDFGGGLGIPYFDHERPLDLVALRDGLVALVAATEGDAWLSATRFVVEPGRFLVGEAGVYLTRVIDVKQSRGKTFVVVDGGMHHHLAASGNLGQTIKRNFPLAAVDRLDDACDQQVDVVGPLCTPLDTLARNAALPALQPGDLLGIFQSGAYARTASPHGFLSHGAPAEVAINQGVARLVRRRGRDDDALADQVIDAIADQGGRP
jgi:diaminopimelate decarboxylase